MGKNINQPGLINQLRIRRDILLNEISRNERRINNPKLLNDSDTLIYLQNKINKYQKELDLINPLFDYYEDEIY